MGVFIKEVFLRKKATEGAYNRVYVRVFNDSNDDFYGYIVLKIHNKATGKLVYQTPQEVLSIFANDDDGVFWDVNLPAGEYEADAMIWPKIDASNTTIADNILSFQVYVDTDRDGIPDIDDLDDDNDGVLDTDEQELGTDPKDPDSDDDGIKDGEDQYPKDPYNNQDTDSDGTPDVSDNDDDNDGLTDDIEQDIGTDPNNVDTDGDGVLDGEEYNYTNTDPLNDDTEQDGLSDGKELDIGTDPLNSDTDNDGVKDGDDAFPLDPRFSEDKNHNGVPDELESEDAHQKYPEFFVDFDNDGLMAYEEEFITHTSDQVYDTDGDGFSDSVEIELGTDPTKYDDSLADYDKDGLTIEQEYKVSTKEYSPYTYRFLGMQIPDKVYYVVTLGSGNVLWGMLIWLIFLVIFGRILKQQVLDKLIRRK